MDVNKKIFSEKDVRVIVSRLKEAEAAGLLRNTPENNEYLLCSYTGTGKISNKWNIKIYKFNQKKNGHSLICTDSHVLQNIISGDFDFTPPDLPVLKIDDSGWGFPLCGVMIGVTDETTLYTAVVPVEYFQGEKFSSKEYLNEYTRLGFELIKKFGASPRTHRIEICSGFVNQLLRDELRKAGFHVRIVEITGMLQSQLEESFRLYIQVELNVDIYYDPKEFDRKCLPQKFSEVLEFGKKNFPGKLKTGWKSIGEQPVK